MVSHFIKIDQIKLSQHLLNVQHFLDHRDYSKASDWASRALNLLQIALLEQKMEPNEKR